MVPDTVTHGTGGNTGTGGVKGMVVGSLKSRRTRERVLALTAALSFVGLLLGAPPFCFGETEPRLSLRSPHKKSSYTELRALILVEL